MNQIESLKIFCSACETLQFAETAQRLNISPQSVSRIINELEQVLGERLFIRSTRQIRLTDFGEQFLPKAQHLLQQSEHLFAKQTKTDELQGKVRITLPDLGNNALIIRRVLAKLADFPDIHLDWFSDVDNLNVVENGIDIGVRMGELPDSRLIAKKICNIDAGIYAAPNLIERLGKPKNFDDFSNRYPQGIFQNSKTGRMWHWILPDGSQYLPSRPRLSCNGLGELLAAAIDGQIATAFPSHIVRKACLRGELAAVFPIVPNVSRMNLYRTPHRILPERVKVVFDVMAEILHEIYGE